MAMVFFGWFSRSGKKSDGEARAAVSVASEAPAERATPPKRLAIFGFELGMTEAAFQARLKEGFEVTDSSGGETEGHGRVDGRSLSFTWRVVSGHLSRIWVVDAAADATKTLAEDWLYAVIVKALGPPVSSVEDVARWEAKGWEADITRVVVRDKGAEPSRAELHFSARVR